MEFHELHNPSNQDKDLCSAAADCDYLSQLNLCFKTVWSSTNIGWW